MQLKPFWTMLVTLSLLIDPLITGALADESFAFDASGAKGLDDHKADQLIPYLNLKRNPDGSVSGALKPGHRLFNNWSDDYRILKIGSLRTKGRSIADLQKLISSKPGEQVTLEVVSRDTGNLIVLDFPSDTNPRVYSDMNGYLDYFGGPQDVASARIRIDNAVANGAVPVAIALLRQTLNGYPYSLESISDSEKLLRIPSALRIFDRGGAFGASDQATDFSVRQSHRKLKTMNAAEIAALADVATYLSKTDRVKAANDVWKNMYATVSDAKPLDQMVVLGGYGEFLNDNKRLGQAAPIFAHLEKICLANLTSQAFPSLQRLIKFNQSQRSYDKAQTLVKKLIEEQRKISPIKIANFLRYQDQIEVLCQSAEIAIARADYTGAHDAYQSAMTLLDEHLNSEELVRLERTVSLCYSSLEYKRGQLCILQRDYSDAIRYLNLAYERIQSSLGEGNPLSKDVLIALGEAHAGQGNQTLASRFSREAWELPNLEPVLPEIDLSWTEAKAAWQLIMRGKFADARAAVSRLIERIRVAEKPLDKFELNRLVYLADSFDSMKQKKTSIEFLNQISDISRREYPSQFNGYVLADLFCALSSATNSPDETSLDQLWDRLSENEFECEQILTTSIRKSSGQRNLKELREREIFRLRRIAMLFLCSDQPQKAESILRRIGEVGNASLKEALMISLIEQKKFDEAEEIIEKKTVFFPMAAVLFQLNGASERARKTIDVMRGRATNELWCARQRFELALAYVRLGMYREALKMYESAKSHEASYLIGFAYKVTGKSEAAIDAFIEAARSERHHASTSSQEFGLRSLAEAAVLMDRQEILKPDAITKSAELLTRVPREEISTQLSETFVRIAQKAAFGSNMPELISARRQILYHENRQDLVAKLMPEQQESVVYTSGDKQISKAQILKELTSKNFDRAAGLIEELLISETYRPAYARSPHPSFRMERIFFKSFEEAGKLNLVERILENVIHAESSKPPTAEDELSTKQFIFVNQLLLIKTLVLAGNRDKALEFARKTFTTQVKDTCHLFTRAPRGFALGDAFVIGFYGDRTESSSFEAMFWPVDDLVQRKDLASAAQLNNLIEDFLRRITGEKNPVHIRYYERVATIAGAGGDVPNVENALATALKLAVWNWGEDDRKTCAIRLKLASALRNCGKPSEAEIVAPVRERHVPNLDEAALFNYKSDVYTTHLGQNGLPETFADTAGASLSERLKTVVQMTGQMSHATISTRAMLIDFYLARKDYASAEKCLSELLSTYQQLEGASADFQCDMMEQIAEVEFLQGNRSTSRSWLDKAVIANIFEYPDINVNCAALFLEMGDLTRAQELLVKAANSLLAKPVPSRDKTFCKCCYLLSKAKLEKLLKQMDDKFTKMLASERGQYPFHSAKPRLEPSYSRKDGIWVRETRASRNTEAEARMKANRMPPEEIQLRARRSQLEAIHRTRRALNRPEEPTLKYIADVEEKLNEFSKERSKAESLVSQLHHESTDYATARIKALQEAEEERAKNESETESKSAERKVRNQRELEKSLAQFEKAKSNRLSDLNAYLDALSHLSYAYERIGNPASAQRTRLEHLDEIETCKSDLSCQQFSTAFSILEKAAAELDETSLRNRFHNLILLCENSKPLVRESAAPVVDRFIDSMQGHGEHRNIEVALCEDWVHVRRIRDGGNSFYLERRLSKLAHIYRDRGDAKNMNRVLSEWKALQPKNNRQWMHLAAQILRFLYGLNRPAEAAEYWKYTCDRMHWEFTDEEKQSILSLSEEVRRRGYDVQADDMAQVALRHPTTHSLTMIDQYMARELKELLERKSYDKAEVLARRFLKLTEKIADLHVNRLWWQEKIKEIDGKRISSPAKDR